MDSFMQDGCVGVGPGTVTLPLVTVITVVVNVVVVVFPSSPETGVVV